MPAVVSDSRSTIASDPLRNFKFLVNIQHTTAAGNKMVNLGFMSCSGLNVETQMIPYRQGGYNTTPQKMPGQSDFAPLTLSRGAMVNTPHAYQWVQEIFATVQGTGSFAPANSSSDFRANIDILVLAHPWTGSTSVPVKARYKVYNAWPSSLGFSDLDAGGNSVLMEQMVLQHEGWRMAYAADSYGTEAGAL